MSLPQRVLKIMYRDTEYTPADIAEFVHVDVAAIAQALAILQKIGLVQPRHGGKFRKGSGFP